MMQALLVLALMGQDVDVAVTGHGRRHGGEYELTVAGKGKGLKDQEIVSLKFRRLTNRMNWEEGALVAAPAEDEVSRVATVENNSFAHQEQFAVPGEVEVRISRSHPDGAPAAEGEIHRVFRVSSLPEEANAIGSAAKRFEGALRGVRKMLDDIEAIRGESCPPARKQAHLQKRIDWRKNAYRQEIADSFLTASAQALGQLLTDLEAALDLERNGKDTAMLVSSLSGKPFSWEEARAQLGKVEALSFRERALLVVRTAVATAQQIADGVRSKEAASWARNEKDITRTLEALREADHAWRTAPSGPQYAVLVDGAGATLEGFLMEAGEYLHAGAACIHCTKPDDGVFAELGRSIMDAAAQFENRVRAQK